FEQSMASLASKYPDDDEARIVYALVLNISADPADRTLANEHKAAAILEPLFIKYPSHPGVAHYLVHTYDYTDLADKGLPSARLYSSIAPSAPHALHMPSHIFSRLGMWKETMESNRASYLAAKGQLTQTTLSLGAVDALH